MNIKEFTSEPKVKNNVYAYSYGIMLAICGFYYGLVIGLFNTFLEEYINKYNLNLGNEALETLKNSCAMYFTCGCTTACAIGEILFNKIGRYKTMLLLIILEIATTVPMALIQDIHIFKIMRFMQGLVGYYWTLLAPLILKENIPSNIRNLCNPMFGFAICGGIQMGYMLGFNGCGEYWRIIMLSPILFSVPKLLGAFFFRMESPIYLINKFNVKINGDKSQDQVKLEEDLKANYSFLYNKFDSDTLTRRILKENPIRLDNLIDENELEMKIDSKIKKIYEENKNQILNALKEYKNQIIVCLTLNFMNQLIGMNILSIFSSDIFKRNGVKDTNNATNIMGLCGLAGTAVVTFFLSFTGMRLMMNLGTLGQIIGHFITILGLYFKNGFLIVTGVDLAMFAYCTSMGGINFSYNASIVPSFIVSKCAFLQWFLLIILLKVLKPTTDYLGYGNLFLSFQIFAVIGGLIFLKIGIETNNKDAQTIKNEFKQKSLFSF